MESTKDELQKSKARDELRTKEITQLKLERSKKDTENKKWKDEAASKGVCHLTCHEEIQ